MTRVQGAMPDGVMSAPTAPGRTLGGEIAAELRAAVSEARAWMIAVPETESHRRPRPEGWSPREIIGHLIDSASNNHGRFVRGALEESLVFATYDQEAWVALHCYQEQSWASLVARWTAFNEQVAVTIEHIAENALTRRRREHNFDRIAWKTVAASEPATLEYFIRDYIGHLRHHLAQVAAIVGPLSR
ncbi:MAG: DinB family protein [Gemmatimonadaceae bacterium]